MDSFICPVARCFDTFRCISTSTAGIVSVFFIFYFVGKPNSVFNDLWLCSCFDLHIWAWLFAAGFPCLCLVRPYSLRSFKTVVTTINASILIRYYRENKVYLLLCSFRVHQSVHWLQNHNTFPLLSRLCYYPTPVEFRWVDIFICEKMVNVSWETHMMKNSFPLVPVDIDRVSPLVWSKSYV